MWIKHYSKWSSFKWEITYFEFLGINLTATSITEIDGRMKLKTQSTWETKMKSFKHIGKKYIKLIKMLIDKL